MCSGRHCAKTKDGESPGAIQLSHARQWRRRRRWRRWRRHSNNYKGLRAKLSRAGWRGNSRAFTNTPSLVCYGHDTVARSLAYVNGTRTPPPSSSLPRVSASESSDTHCAIPLCYLFPSQVYAARTHTHTRTHWLRSFPVSTATMPPFLLRSFFSPLLPANSLRFQLQTLVRPFLIIFQLPTPLVLPFSSTIHPEFNFSSLSLSRSKISNGGEIFATGRNAAETFRSSVFAGSQFRRIRRRIGKNREKRGGKERTKLNL